MSRSRLRNKFQKTKSQECKQAYNNQRNLCITMVLKREKNHFNNLNVRKIADNKQFWKTVKPFLSSKVGYNEGITVIEGDKVASGERKVAGTFKSYFETIVENLGINSKFMFEEPVSNKPVKDIIRKFQNYPNIIKIKEKYQGHFIFSGVEVGDVDREIDSLDASEAIQQNDISIKIIKANRDIFLNLLCIILTKISLLQGFLTFSKVQR